MITPNEDVKWYQRPRSMIPSKIWKAGKGTGKRTILASIPHEYGSFEGPVYMDKLRTGLSDEMIIIRRSEKTPEVPGETTFLDHEHLVYQAIGAYVNGFSRLYFEIPVEKSGEIVKLSELVSKLDAHIERRAEIKGKIPVLLTFSTPTEHLGKPKTVLNAMYENNNEMSKILAEELLSKLLSKESKELETLYNERFSIIENFTDRDGFYAKRLLNHIQNNPELIKDVGLTGLSDLSRYYCASIELERVADLQKDIFQGLQTLNNRMRDRHEKRNVLSEHNYGLKEYFLDIYSFFKTAYEGLDNFEKAIAVVRTKRDNDPNRKIHYLGTFVTPEKRKEILDLVNSNKEPWSHYTNSLTWLQSKMWEIAEITTNLGELGVAQYHPEISRRELESWR